MPDCYSLSILHVFHRSSCYTGIEISATGQYCANIVKQSEAIAMQSGSDAPQSVKTIKVRTGEVAIRMQVHPSTVYRRADKYGWIIEQDAEGLSWTTLPVETWEAYQPASEAPMTQPNAPAKQYATPPEAITMQPQSIPVEVAMQIFAELRQVQDERVKDRERAVRAEEQVVILNRELEERNTKLQLYREKEREAKQPEKRPWWHFW